MPLNEYFGGVLRQRIMRLRLFSRRGNVLPSGVLSPQKSTRWVIGSAVASVVVAVSIGLARRCLRRAVGPAADSGSIPDSDHLTTLPRTLESPTIAASPGGLALPMPEPAIINSAIGDNPDVTVTAATDVSPSPDVIVETSSFDTASVDETPSPESSPIAASPLAAIKQPQPWRAPTRQGPRRLTLRRLMMTAVLILSSVALVYGALGAIRSHNNKRSASDSKTGGPLHPASLAQIPANTAPVDTPAPYVPAVAEPAPPAENGEPQDAATPANSSATATATPKTHIQPRKHQRRLRVRSHKSNTETGSMLPRIH